MFGNNDGRTSPSFFSKTFPEKKKKEYDCENFGWCALIVFGIVICVIIVWQIDASNDGETTTTVDATTCAERYKPYYSTDFFGMPFDFNDREAKEELHVAHFYDMLDETRQVFGSYDRVWPLTVLLTKDQPVGIQAWFGTWPEYGYCNLGIFIENDNDYMWRWHRTLMVHEYAHWFHYHIRDVADLSCLADMWARIDELSDASKNIFVNQSYAAWNINEFYACAMEMYAAQPDVYPVLASDFGKEDHWASYNMFTHAELSNFTAGQDLIACMDNIMSQFSTFGT